MKAMRQTTTCRRGGAGSLPGRLPKHVNRVKPSPDITHELARLTDRLIAYRVVRRLKDPSFMSKFSDLAGMTRDTLKKWDAEADDIMAQHHKLEAEGDDLFRRYRASQAQKRAEFTQMRDAIRDLSGANLPNEGEASPASSNSSAASHGTASAATPPSSRDVVDWIRELQREFDGNCPGQPQYVALWMADVWGI